MRIAFESGTNQITGGSIAVKNPNVFEKWISVYGSDKVILGADCNDEKIAISGWQEESDIEVIPFIKSYQSKGVDYVICTDILKDGMLQGPSFNLYERILKECHTETVEASIKLIASGGISMYDELPRLAEMGCEGVIIGKAIYENRISLKELEQFILNNL